MACEKCGNGCQCGERLHDACVCGDGESCTYKDVCDCGKKESDCTCQGQEACDCGKQDRCTCSKQTRVSSEYN